jgi:hypothetical protein
MKRPSIFLVVAAAGLSALSVTPEASALGPVDVEVAAKLGGGTNPEGLCPHGCLAPPPNALGLGLGARAGASFFGFYAGLSFMDYLGTSQGAGVPTPALGKGALRSVLYGIEAGYNFSVSFVTLRPLIGVGNYALLGSGVYGSGFDAQALYLEAGIAGLVTFGRWIVGVDENVLLVPGLTVSPWQPAFTAHGQVGIKF